MTGFKSELAISIARELSKDDRTKESPIEVVDDNGVITLTGSVVSDEARSAAEAIARAQEGVVSVISDLELVESEEPLLWPLTPGRQE